EVTKDLEGNFQFNTAISRVMELVNDTYKVIFDNSVRKEIFQQAVDTVFLVLAPFTPHLSEEVNEKFGNKCSVLNREWPKVEEKYLKEDNIEIAVLVNGKIKDKLLIGVDWTQDAVKEKAFSLDKVKRVVSSKPIKKVIYVDKKIVNIVI
ncbi:MAG: class I tRNA ligase family protein, partial [Candidatus Omnitrophica bacterium]|nr:class I tRNA ligase family protein [Candidatus Omnitrophota bacterium]